MQIAPPTKDDFAKLLLNRIRQAGEKEDVVYEAEEFRLRGLGERAGVLNLQNAHKEYCAVAVDAREQVLKHWVRNWFAYLRELPEDFQDARPDLMPVVRSRAFFELNSLRGKVESGIPFFWPHQVLGEHFGVALVYDLPDSMRSITQRDLDAWGITFYEAMEAARENLAALDAKFIGPESGNGVCLSTTVDSYDASRLILTDVIRQLPVQGDPVAMIPNRETLIVAGSEDATALSAMVLMATESLDKPRPISGIALRLDGDEWLPWLPEVSHPHYDDFRRLHLQSLGQDYAGQKDLLDKMYESNEEVFVATFSATEVPDGRLLSYGVWTAGVETLLPKSDVLVLGRFGGKPQMVEWQTVIEVAGDLFEPLDIYPPRYRARDFPTDQQVAAMGNMLG